MDGARLVGDIGGTNARFAVQPRAGAPLADLAVLPCADHSGLLAAARHYLAHHTTLRPQAAVLAIATAVTGDVVRMTNLDWTFSIAELQAGLGLARLRLINDFTALALALPVIPPAELHPIGAGQPVAGAALALIGPGTGLGVSGLVPARGGLLAPLVGEGGHVTLAPADETEAAVVAWLVRRHGHASAERALSGQGLVNLHMALTEQAGQPPAPLDAAEITRRALAGGDALCDQTLGVFFGLLGSTAGNLALTLGARGGVYIGGGIAPRLLERMQASTFRARFEAKGRFEAYLRAVPTWVVTSADSPALAGAARAFELLD